MGFIIRVCFVVGPVSLIVLVNCWDGFIFLSSSLMRPVSSLGHGHCFFVSLLGRVHYCVRFIVGAGFIVRPRSLYVLVQCLGGSIFTLGSLLGSVLFLGRGHCCC